MSSGSFAQLPLSRRSALLVALAVLVHWTWFPVSVVAQVKRGAAKSGNRGGPNSSDVIVGHGPAGLPPAVAEMYAAIKSAVETNDIAELRGAMDLNELKPELGGPPGVDPIEYLRGLSTDGKGKDVLEALGRLLDGSWAAIPGGRDIENNRIYVWPHFAEVPLNALSTDEQTTLAALVGGDRARAMIASRRYQGWRLSIGADGVWHMFVQLKG
jgi:hypothetical protein